MSPNIDELSKPLILQNNSDKIRLKLVLRIYAYFENLLNAIVIMFTSVTHTLVVAVNRKGCYSWTLAPVQMAL